MLPNKNKVIIVFQKKIIWFDLILKGFLFGGHDDEYTNNCTTNNDLHMFDLTSHLWTHLQPTTGSLPPERQESQMIVRGTDLIIYGGDANWVFFDCWVWSIEEKSWREVEDYFDQRWSHTACYTSDDDNVLVFGGIDQFHETLGSLGRVSFGHLDQKKGKRMTSCDDEECTSTFINDELEDHDPWMNWIGLNQWTIKKWNISQHKAYNSIIVNLENWVNHVNHVFVWWCR